MSPRLEVIARYHQGYRRAMRRVRRLESAGCDQLANEQLAVASRIYVALFNEKDPQYARERS